MENIIIIGGGPAGISAALYAARSGRDPLVIEHGAGGLKKAEKIENYYGGGTLSGQELYDRGIDQAKTLGVRILTAQVVGVEGFDTFTVHTDQGDFDAKAVILATGTSRKAPVIPGLKELEGRGVSYCAVCDAFFYRGRDVASHRKRRFRSERSGGDWKRGLRSDDPHERPSRGLLQEAGISGPHRGKSKI